MIKEKIVQAKQEGRDALLKELGVIGFANRVEIKEIQEQAKSELRKELREIIANIFQEELRGIKERGTLTPSGEATLKVLEEIRDDLLLRFQDPKE